MRTSATNFSVPAADPKLDMMIGADSLSAGAVLVTNKLPRYKRIDAPLILENWV